MPEYLDGAFCGEAVIEGLFGMRDGEGDFRYCGEEVVHILMSHANAQLDAGDYSFRFVADRTGYWHRLLMEDIRERKIEPPYETADFDSSDLIAWS